VRRFRRWYIPRPVDHRRMDLALEIELEMDDEMELEIMTLAAI
jgi:hypothetical protein